MTALAANEKKVGSVSPYRHCSITAEFDGAFVGDSRDEKHLESGWGGRISM